MPIAQSQGTGRTHQSLGHESGVRAEPRQSRASPQCPGTEFLSRNCPAGSSRKPANELRGLWGTQPSGEGTDTGFAESHSWKHTTCMHVLGKKSWRRPSDLLEVTLPYEFVGKQACPYFIAIIPEKVHFGCNRGRGVFLIPAAQSSSPRYFILSLQGLVVQTHQPYCLSPFHRC